MAFNDKISTMVVAARKPTPQPSPRGEGVKKTPTLSQWELEKLR
jgi:hypothetical protein